MKTRKILLLLILTLNLISCKGIAQEKGTIETTTVSDCSKDDVNFPEPIGYVNDFERIFTSDQKNQLEKIISEFEEQTTKEISIVTISSIEPYDDIGHYAADLAQHWGVGKSDSNNGLLIIFSQPLREIFIATGLGTEKILTDDICKSVIDEIIIPEFRDGEFYTGIEKGVRVLISKWK